MTQRAATWLRRLVSDARGLTTVEYTIVLCLIAALGVAAWARFGTDLSQSIGRSNVTIRDHLHVSQKGANR